MIISTDLLPKVIIITLNVGGLNFFSMDKMWLTGGGGGEGENRTYLYAAYRAHQS